MELPSLLASNAAYPIFSSKPSVFFVRNKIIIINIFAFATSRTISLKTFYCQPLLSESIKCLSPVGFPQKLLKKDSNHWISAEQSTLWLNLLLKLRTLLYYSLYLYNVKDRLTDGWCLPRRTPLYYITAFDEEQVIMLCIKNYHIKINVEQYLAPE